MSTNNPFKRPMNALQKQWYRILVARKVGTVAQQLKPRHKEPTYQSVCYHRYKDAFRIYNQQLNNEIEQLETMQPSAMDAMRFHRCFAITTLWPPLHSKRQINRTLDQLEKVLSVKERRRLEQILARTTKRI